MVKMVLLALLPFSAPAMAQQPCVASAPQVVDEVYQQVLERPADPGSAELTQALAAGRMTVRDVVAALAKSPEYEERFFWPPIVAAAYEQVMQRQPSAAEMGTAVAGLARGGMTPPTFVARLATRAANNNPNAIGMVYRRLLGRDPDPEGLAAYRQLAEREGLEAVTQSIVSSPEYRARATATGMPMDGMQAYGPAVRGLYRRLLGRDADPEGLRAQVEVASVYGLKGPVDRVLNSPEYLQRVGENGVPGRGRQFCGESPTRTAVPRRFPRR